ncbi:MAG: type VI secretion system lipoprotein TssJ [Alphaproteobacteria bacterium]
MALAVAGCADDPAEGPPPTAVTLSVEASPFLNPDRTNRPSPVVVVIYGLTDDAAFNNGGYYELFEQDQQTLGEAIKTKQQFIIAPGDIKDVELALDPAATFLAVLAAFRDIDNAKFSASVPLTPSQAVEIQVKLQSNEVVLIAPEPPVVSEDGEEQSDESQ